MSIALLVITDGRLEYLERTIASAREMLRGPITERWMYDDTGDAAHRALLSERYPDFEHFNAGARQGFAGAIQAAWAEVGRRSLAKFVFHLEQDFTFPRPVDLAEMMALLDEKPHLAQVALRRQAWGAEIPHGGFMEMAPAWYGEQRDDRRSWVETTRNFTTNPSLYRRELMAVGWPDAPHSEGLFGFKLKDLGLPWGVAGADVRFGFLGSMAEGREATWHIGDHRAGNGY